MSDHCKNQLAEQVKSIARALETGVKATECHNCEHYFEEGETTCPVCSEERGNMDGFDYLQDASDIQYIVNRDREFIGARVLVAFGGPNIWIDTQAKRVEGYWWGDYAEAHYSADAMDIEGALEELWNC